MTILSNSDLPYSAADICRALEQRNAGTRKLFKKYTDSITKTINAVRINIFLARMIYSPIILKSPTDFIFRNCRRHDEFTGHRVHKGTVFMTRLGAQKGIPEIDHPNDPQRRPGFPFFVEKRRDPSFGLLLPGSIPVIENSRNCSVVYRRRNKKLFFSAPHPGVRRSTRRMVKPPAGRWDEGAEKNMARGSSRGNILDHNPQQRHVRCGGRS